jgi:hypothetical protein
VDTISENIKVLNENLKDVIKRIDGLCKILPEDLKMEEVIPVPLLSLDTHHEVQIYLERKLNNLRNMKKRKQFILELV